MRNLRASDCRQAPAVTSPGGRADQPWTTIRRTAAAREKSGCFWKRLLKRYLPPSVPRAASKDSTIFVSAQFGILALAISPGRTFVEPTIRVVLAGHGRRRRLGRLTRLRRPDGQATAGHSAWLVLPSATLAGGSVRSPMGTSQTVVKAQKIAVRQVYCRSACHTTVGTPLRIRIPRLSERSHLWTNAQPSCSLPLLLPCLRAWLPGSTRASAAAGCFASGSVPNTTGLSGKKVTSVSARESWSSVKKSARSWRFARLPSLRAPIFQAGGMQSRLGSSLTPKVPSPTLTAS